MSNELEQREPDPIRDVDSGLEYVEGLIQNSAKMRGVDSWHLVTRGLLDLFRLHLRASQPQPAPVPVAAPSNIADAWWPTVEAALELASSQYRGNLGTRALMVAEAADRIPFPFRTKLAIADDQPQPATGDSPHQAMASAPGEEEPGPANWPAGRRKLDPSTGEVTVYMWGLDDGIAKGRSEAEAMREVCDVARQYVSVVRLHGREVEPGSTEARLFEVVDALSGTGWPLRPGKGTPDGNR